MSLENWTIERNSAYSTLFDVYDEDGNRIVGYKPEETAYLIYAAPLLLAACESAEQALRNLATGFLTNDGAEIAHNEAGSLRTVLDTARGEA